MANITAKDVAELRKQTGVGMMDCKKALVEADGDFEKATVLLREKGLATQAKKSGRVAAEGIVMAMTNDDHTVGAVVEVNIETDFAANNEEFKKFVEDVAKTIIEKNPADVEALNAAQISGGSTTVAEALQELFLKIRENMHIRRFKRLEGVLVPYVHGGGKIGVMVNMETPAGATDAVLTCGKDCALQVAALKAPYLKREDVPADVIESEKNIMLAQMNDDPKMSSKPEQVKAKIVEGKVGKYYSENCLLEQEFVKDGNFTVQKYIDHCAKEAGTEIKLVDYVCFERGEGVEKKEDNFADEVASMMKK
ncbi:MAG: translation elongation factor Ts [Clostridium sp.]|nr:translation elongation factor Ts [Clostridium sp.]MCM1548158.1 translation elongation factor Ts [Ruminococcus sp.]